MPSVLELSYSNQSTALPFPEFHKRAFAAVFENDPELFPNGRYSSGRGGLARDPESFVAFHHRLQSSTGRMHSGESFRGLFTSGETS